MITSRVHRLFTFASTVLISVMVLSPIAPVVQASTDISWSTFLGGSGSDTGRGIAVDSNGNVYFIATSDATWGSPVRAYTSGNDFAITKLDSSGNLIWNTFLGGTGSDTGRSITVDSNGNVYVTGGSTVTWGTPVRAYSTVTDTVVAKLDTNGNLLWNTFLGGTGQDIGSGVALDSSGNVYITGQYGATWGTPVRAYTASTNDASIAKLDANGNLLWNTFLGGTGSDVGNGIGVDGSGNAYFVGSCPATWGTPVRAYTLGSDSCVAKVDGSGNLLWNTFLGGTGSDLGNGIIVDVSGNAYIAGSSDAAWGSPVGVFTSGTDATAVKLDSNGNIIWNTFFGGSGSDSALGIAFDGSGNSYFVGTSSLSWGSPVRAYTAGTDGFAAKLNNSGNFVWNTFLGGSGTDTPRGVGLDGNRNVFIGGDSTATWGSPLRAYTAGNDGFIVRLTSDLPSSGGGTSHPIIHLTKEATPASLPNGQASVTYTYTITNPGNVTLTDISLVDDKCSDATYVSGDTDGNSFLETSETWIYSCTVVLTKTTVNFATAQGFGGGLVTSDTAIAEVVVSNAPPVPPETAPTSTEPTPPPVIYRDLRNALVKLPDDTNATTQEDSAVYYIGSDGHRHAFPNDKIYFTWYTSFNGVQVMNETQLASIPLGKNITYKPGVKMVKFTTDPKVYAVSRNGTLRLIASESVAVSLYGSNWNTKIDDISDAFFTNYQFGADITSASDYNPAQEEASVSFPGDSL